MRPRKKLQWKPVSSNAYNYLSCISYLLISLTHKKKKYMRTGQHRSLLLALCNSLTIFVVTKTDLNLVIKWLTKARVTVILSIMLIYSRSQYIFCQYFTDNIFNLLKWALDLLSIRSYLCILHYTVVQLKMIKTAQFYVTGFNIYPEPYFQR